VRQAFSFSPASSAWTTLLCGADDLVVCGVTRSLALWIGSRKRLILPSRRKPVNGIEQDRLRHRVCRPQWRRLRIGFEGRLVVLVCLVLILAILAVTALCGGGHSANHSAWRPLENAGQPGAGAPTLLELCGLPQVPGLDGTSFMPDLREPAKTRDTTVFAEYNLRNPRAKYMIRRGDYKYNYYVNDMAELCNLRDDPKEMRNLALESASAAKVAELKAQLFAWHKPQEKIVQ
jgi:hypothetical protein